MEKITFQEWMKGDSAEKHRFYLLQLNISRRFWEQSFFPQVKEKFHTDIVHRFSDDKSWKVKEPDLLIPSLFPKKEIIMLDGVSEEVAHRLSHKAIIPPHCIVLYFISQSLKKNWLKGIMILIEFEEQDFAHWVLQVSQGLSKNLSPLILKTLYKYWWEYDLLEGDIIDFLLQAKSLPNLSITDLEIFFEKSEKTLLFRFLDALSDRNADLSNQFFFALMKINYPPILLVTMIARRYRLIAQIISTKEENKDLWKNTKLNSFEIQKIKKYTKKYSLSDFKEIFNSLRQLDRLLKTTNSDFTVLMLDLIHQIAVRTAQPKVYRGDSASSANEI